MIDPLDPDLDLTSPEARVIDCPLSCVIPAGYRLAEVPPPRHDWTAVIGCPNEGCARWFWTRMDDDDRS
jgi:hypothetical protein